MLNKKIIILGASGYIGVRLSKKLSNVKELILFNRNQKKLEWLKKDNQNIQLYDIALKQKNKNKLKEIFKEADCIYYLIHSMDKENNKNFQTVDNELAEFVSKIASEVNVKKIVYLGGLGKDELSKHLKSRQETGDFLRKHHKNVIEFRAGTIIGGGSASFEIIRTLATKLPFIPVFWKKEGKCEPIFVDNVIYYLLQSIKTEYYNNQILEIGCGEQYTYTELVQIYANQILKRNIKIIKLSFLEKIIPTTLIGRIISFMVGQSKELVTPLVDGVKYDAIVYNNIQKIHNEHIKNLSLKKSYEIAFKRTNNNQLISVWDIPCSLSKMNKNFFNFQEKEGLLYEEKLIKIHQNDIEKLQKELMNLGYFNKCYWSNKYLWKLRAIIDKLLGGIGISHFKNYTKEIHIGSRIDFWIVEELIDTNEKFEFRLKAQLEMPGNAWLQYFIDKKTNVFYIRAFFEPHNIIGYLYWYSLYIFHKYIFNNMLKNIMKNINEN